jgi:hypothetical protein
VRKILHATIDQRETRDLQRLCITCGDKRRCEYEIAAGTAAKNKHEFCPNAETLDRLFKTSCFNAAEPKH